MIPVCYTQTFKGGDNTKVASLQYDIFPSTLDGFMSLGDKFGGGQGLNWDIAFGTVWDADGDGLISSGRNGADPNDSLADTDADGLTDLYELDQREAGVAYSPVQCDTDGDGLTDRQEALYGTNPARTDTDTDGLNDGEEVWHAVYNANCQPTGGWTGGWDIRINGATALTVHVSSNPAAPDEDGDGLSDLAEKQLVNSVDSLNRPYNPVVANTSALQVTTVVDDVDGFLRPGQTVDYTTTVVNNLRVAPGVLSVEVPPVLGTSPSAYLLPFNTVPQTITQRSSITVASNASTQPVTIDATARTRFPDVSAATLSWIPTATQSLGTFTNSRLGRFVDAAPSRPDREDSYLMDTLVRGTSFYDNELLDFAIPGGQTRTLRSGLSGSVMRSTAPTIACNDTSTCLAMWGESVGSSLPEYRIGGALLNSDGSERRSVAFGRPLVGTDTSRAVRAVVASDGDGFLMASEVLNRTARPEPNNWDLLLAVQYFDRDGTAGTSYFYPAATNRSLTSDPQISMDMIWIGDRYRLVWKLNGGSSLYMGEFNGAAGGRLAADWGTISNTVAATTVPSLAFDPTVRRGVLSFQLASGGNNNTTVYLWSGANTQFDRGREFSNAQNARVAYDAGIRRFLTIYKDTASNQWRYTTLTSDTLSELRHSITVLVR